MTTPTTLHSRPISRARRALVAGAVLGSAVAGVAANVAAAPEAAAATTYIRFENIIDRWAMNTGFDQGTTAEGAPVQTWSWSHRDPHDWNSQWSWKHMGSGYYQYKNRWSGKCLDVASLSFSASMIQSTCSTSDKGQQWLDVGAGKHKGRQTYTLHNRGVTEKLGVTMTAEADHTGIGAKVRVRVLNGFSSPQRWYFSYVTGLPQPPPSDLAPHGRAPGPTSEGSSVRSFSRPPVAAPQQITDPQ